jgi:hypothetical protein
MMNRSDAAPPWPLLAALAAYWAGVAILVWLSLGLNQGHLAYALDDPYIHMAMAKNAALHGVWGVTRDAFSSTSSSPLWTALLALIYAVAGVNEVAPFLLNLVAGSLTIVVAERLVRRGGGHPAWTCAVLLVVVFGGALPTLTLTGMEHTLHALVTLAFAAAAAAVIAAGGPARWTSVLGLAGLAAALTAVRYEGLFAVAVVVILFAFTRRLLAAAIVGAAGLAPPLAYGAWAAMNGWYFLPNSVLLKGNVPEAGFVGVAKVLVWWNAANALPANPHVLVLVTASLVAVLCLPASRGASWRVTLNVLVVASTMLHLQFAKTGWFFRYEAYLLVLGIAVLGATAAPWVGMLTRPRLAQAGRPRLAAGALLVVILAAPLSVRAVRALQAAPQATRITYEQQYQLGRFLDRFYRGSVVAVNDIGAMTFLADIRVLDLVGLATMEVAAERRGGRFDHHRIDVLSQQHGVEIAIVYDSWLLANGGIPSSWRKAGEWTGSAPDSTVAFYAVGAPGEAGRLEANLAAFLPDLPPAVTARGGFID